MAEKRYYWLKLKRDFFKRHDIRIIESMPNGKDYVLFYLKLMLESVDHEGALRFSETIPYNEEMLSVITGTNIDIVRAAMKLFVELKMVEVFDDNTIYMNEVQRLVGSETKWAEKKRKFRQKEDNVPALSPPCPTDVRQEIEKEIEIELEIEKEGIEPPSEPLPPPPPPKPAEPERHKHGQYGWVKLTDDEYVRLLKDFGESETNRCITYVDESAQATGNKNRWKDWNLVVRKCHREKWGVKKSYDKPNDRGSNVFMEMLNERRGHG